jgi:hypothetical protein
MQQLPSFNTSLQTDASMNNKTKKKKKEKKKKKHSTDRMLSLATDKSQHDSSTTTHSKNARIKKNVEHSKTSEISFFFPPLFSTDGTRNAGRLHHINLSLFKDLF